MLATAAIVEAVAAAIEELQLPFLVVDPVLVSGSGTRLLDDDGIEAMRTELIPLARVVTPNIPEAEALSGTRIATIDDCRAAARKIHQIGAAAVIVTGGHGAGREVVDLLFDGRTFIELRTPRVDAPRTHGTGCTFASAVAAGLAHGQDLSTAAANAQEYVAGAIRHGFTPGRGRLVLNHFWQIDAERRSS
jgi:hydroxymethylpyrimidine/phosphomethylpyrimidine kinase